MPSVFDRYAKNVISLAGGMQWGAVEELSKMLLAAWEGNRQVFLCGNGGSAANAMHLANDYLYGIGTVNSPGLRVEALSANPSVLTCLGNDLGYDQIFSEQLRVKGRPEDILVVFSGSGNSPNVIRALEMGNELDMKTCAILGFSGGQCIDLAQLVIHIKIDDMQIAEDFQLIVGHMCMRWLCESIRSQEVGQDT